VIEAVRGGDGDGDDDGDDDGPSGEKGSGHPKRRPSFSLSLPSLAHSFSSEYLAFRPQCPWTCLLIGRC
jgi:hypothetical protein